MQVTIQNISTPGLQTSMVRGAPFCVEFCLAHDSLWLESFTFTIESQPGTANEPGAGRTVCCAMDVLNWKPVPYSCTYFDMCQYGPCILEFSGDPTSVGVFLIIQHKTSSQRWYYKIAQVTILPGGPQMGVLNFDSTPYFPSSVTRAQTYTLNTTVKAVGGFVQYPRLGLSYINGPPGIYFNGAGPLSANPDHTVWIENNITGLNEDERLGLAAQITVPDTWIPYLQMTFRVKAGRKIGTDYIVEDTRDITSTIVGTTECSEGEWRCVGEQYQSCVDGMWRNYPDTLGRCSTTPPTEEFTVSGFVNSHPVAPRGTIATLTIGVNCSLDEATRDVAVKVSVWNIQKTAKLSEFTVPIPIKGLKNKIVQTSWDTALFEPAQYVICANLVA